VSNKDLPPLPWHISTGVGCLNIFDRNRELVVQIIGKDQTTLAIADMILEKAQAVAANRRLGSAE
jgi:hypothetical protein